MISFEVDDPALVPKILSGGRCSLCREPGRGGSLITFPDAQTHTDMPPEMRERLGIHDRLLRLSVGIENVDDLIEDLMRHALVSMEGTDMK